MENTKNIQVQVLQNRFVIRGTQETFDNLKRGLEVKAQDMLDIGKDGKAKLVLIKQDTNGVITLVAKPIGSNLSNYDKLVLVDLLPNHLTASIEETKAFIDNPSAIIERVLSSGARFTEQDLQGLPKEAHSLIYDYDKNGAKVFKVINVNTNKEYARYGIKSQIDRKVARVLVAYCENATEMQSLTKEQRMARYTLFNIKLVEYNDYIASNPSYKK